MSRAATVVLVLMLSSRLSATGFFINQQSVKGQGRVGSGNAVAADELGTVFGNPAGLKKTVPSSSAATALPEPTRPWPLTLCWLMKKPVAERRDESMRTSTTVAALDMAVPTAREGEVRVIH